LGGEGFLMENCASLSRKKKKKEEVLGKIKGNSDL